MLLAALCFADPARPMRWYDWLHFAPLALVAGQLLPFYLLDDAAKLAALDAGIDGRLAPLVLFKGVQVLAYQAAVIVLCGRFLKAGNSSNRARLGWLRRVAVVTLVPVLAVHLLYFFPRLGPIESDRAGSLVVAVVLYWFAWAAMRGPGFRSAADGDAPSGQGASPPPRYRTSALDPGRKARLRDALLDYVQAEQALRQPDLSPADIAAALGISAHELSQLLNEVLETNFHRFVNRYRVDFVMQRLADPEFEQSTLLELAYDAGFNSKTSFNRVFRAHTGLTPSLYRRRQRGQPRPASAAAADSLVLTDKR